MAHTETGRAIDDSQSLPQVVEENAGANNIGQYLPLATKTTQTFAGLSTDVYNLWVKQFGERMHPDFPRAFRFAPLTGRCQCRLPYLPGLLRPHTDSFPCL
jgi:hypothetical protein